MDIIRFMDKVIVINVKNFRWATFMISDKNNSEFNTSIITF